MMTTYILPIVILVLLYIVLKLSVYLLPVVEAGTISGKKSTGVSRASRPIMSAYEKIEGSTTFRYRRFIVKGTCMVPLRINENDIIDVKLFNESYGVDKIKKDSVVLIFLNDKEFRGYKIRAVDYIDDSYAYTYYFDSDQNRVNSSKPHSLKAIKGVVQQN